MFGVHRRSGDRVGDLRGVCVCLGRFKFRIKGFRGFWGFGVLGFWALWAC